MNEAKEAILAAIRLNKPAAVARPSLRDFGRSGVEGNLLETFKKNLKAASGGYYDVKDAEEARWLLKQIHPDAKVVCSVVTEIKGNRQIISTDDPHLLEDVEVGIIRAQFGIAENGAVWLAQKDLVVDALGFLSQHLIILLDPDAMVTHMHEAYQKVDIATQNYGCFMMGPSATADISAVHISGAQGARSLNVFFMKSGLKKFQ
jgi:L-lactate dehydrogenase complex protein LldG